MNKPDTSYSQVAIFNFYLFSTARNVSRIKKKKEKKEKKITDCKG